MAISSRLSNNPQLIEAATRALENEQIIPPHLIAEMANMCDLPFSGRGATYDELARRISAPHQEGNVLDQLAQSVQACYALWRNETHRALQQSERYQQASLRAQIISDIENASPNHRQERLSTAKTMGFAIPPELEDPQHLLTLAQNGDAHTIRAFMRHPYLTDTHRANALLVSAYFNSPASIEAILSDERAQNLPPGTERGVFEQSVLRCAENGHIDCLEQLLNSNNALRIFDRRLAHILNKAIENGQYNCANSIICKAAQMGRLALLRDTLPAAPVEQICDANVRAYHLAIQQAAARNDEALAAYLAEQAFLFEQHAALRVVLTAPNALGILRHFSDETRSACQPFCEEMMEQYAAFDNVAGFRRMLLLEANAGEKALCIAAQLGARQCVDALVEIHTAPPSSSALWKAAAIAKTSGHNQICNYLANIYIRPEHPFAFFRRLCFFFALWCTIVGNNFS